MKQVTGIQWAKVQRFRDVMFVYAAWILVCLALTRFIPSLGLIVLWSLCSAMVLVLGIIGPKSGWNSKMNYALWTLLGAILGPWVVLMTLTMNLVDARAMRTLQGQAKKEYIDALEEIGCVDEFQYEELTQGQSQHLVLPDKDPEWQ